MSFQENLCLPSAALPVQAGAGLQVLVALPDQHDVFSLAILLDLLAAANRKVKRSDFVLTVVCAAKATESLQRIVAGTPANRCLILLADAEMPADFPPALTAHLPDFWVKGGMVGAWGTGCLALAKAGLLAGHPFALAPDLRDDLQERWPDLTPDDKTFCSHDRILTSPGKAVLSDMVLHLIETMAGRATMVAVMDHCLIHRAPGDGHPMPGRKIEPPRKADPRMADLDRWIDSNIARRFTTRELAEKAGLSVRHLERLYMRHLGETPAAHLRQRRLTHALRLMRETDLAVEDIARSSGHNCPTRFRKTFKRKFGDMATAI